MDRKQTSENEERIVDYTEYDSVSHAIISSLATMENTEVTELKPVYNSVDLEAVDQLFIDNTNENLIVEQMIDGFEITIRGDGTLTIRESDY